MWRHILCATFATLLLCDVAAAQETKADPQETPDSAEPPPYTELIVVTASRTEEQLLRAPAAITVISADTIARSPARNIPDLLASAPGLNVIQTSARDFNVTSRGATKTTANTQLVLIDGRSIYQDFLGFVLWDALPLEPDEIRQIEIVRGPASAVWGANAMDGIVNILTKSPRDIAGSSVSIGTGLFDRNAGTAHKGAGGFFSASATHAAAVNDRWAYKVSAGFSAQQALPRPSGFLPNPFQTRYPPFANSGTSAPKVDARVDYDFPRDDRKLVMSGGLSGVSGIMHTGSGPFQIQAGSVVGYGRAAFSSGKLQVNTFVNFVDGDAVSLLSVDANGRPIPFRFKSETSDVELGHSRVLGMRQFLHYGGNLRYSRFDLTVAPGGRSRAEGGAYIHDQIFFNDRVQWLVSGRLDKLGAIDRLVFSPRTALVLTPHPRHSLRVSINRAFRSPTLINNYLDLTLGTAIDLGLINPALAGQMFPFPVKTIGNLALREESMTTYEVGHTVNFGARRALLGASYYVNNKKNSILLDQTASYTSATPPPGWPLPPFVLDALIAAGAGLPATLMDSNFGRFREQGIEVTGEARIQRDLSAGANYAWQKRPSGDAKTVGAINVPPSHHVNVSATYDRGRYYSTFAVNHVGAAMWRDVLDARFHGPTSAYTRLDAGGGLRWSEGKRMLSVKVLNLTNRAIQHHVFGDILKIQAGVEFRVRL